MAKRVEVGALVLAYDPGAGRMRPARVVALVSGDCYRVEDADSFRWVVGSEDVEPVQARPGAVDWDEQGAPGGALEVPAAPTEAERLAEAAYGWLTRAEPPREAPAQGQPPEDPAEGPEAAPPATWQPGLFGGAESVAVQRELFPSGG